MRIDLRVRHDVETRRLAAGLLADGSGRAAAVRRPSVPEAAVRRWRQIYRAFGSGALLTLDGKRAGCAYGQKAAAARAVVEDGTARALPRGRRGGARAQVEGRAQGLEGQAARARPRAGARGALLEARDRGGQPKKLRALIEGDGLWPGRGPRR